MKQFYKSKGAGGLQLNISKGDSLSVKIPLPNVANQDLVVEQLDTLSKETQHLTRLYERKLAALEELKKSLRRALSRGKRPQLFFHRRHRCPNGPPNTAARG